MKCLICKNPIEPGEILETCGKCANPFHRECWTENGGCGTPGCPNLPKADKHGEELWAQSYWGATTKICPACKETIGMGEFACPHCKQRFDSMSPETPLELKERIAGPAGSARQTPEMKGALIVFICGLLGCLAPFNLIIGGIWYKKARPILKDASPVHGLLAFLGLIFSAFYLVLMTIGLIVLRP